MLNQLIEQMRCRRSQENYSMANDGFYHTRCALYNLSVAECSSEQYCHGLMVGVTGALMDMLGMNYEETIPIVCEFLPDDVDMDRVIPTFRKDVEKWMSQQTE